MALVVRGAYETTCFVDIFLVCAELARQPLAQLQLRSSDSFNHRCPSICLDSPVAVVQSSNCAVMPDTCTGARWSSREMSERRLAPSLG